MSINKIRNNIKVLSTSALLLLSSVVCENVNAVLDLGSCDTTVSVFKTDSYLHEYTSEGLIGTKCNNFDLFIGGVEDKAWGEEDKFNAGLGISGKYGNLSSRIGIEKWGSTENSGDKLLPKDVNILVGSVKFKGPFSLEAKALKILDNESTIKDSEMFIGNLKFKLGIDVGLNVSHILDNGLTKAKIKVGKSFNLGTKYGFKITPSIQSSHLKEQFGVTQETRDITGKIELNWKNGGIQHGIFYKERDGKGGVEDQNDFGYKINYRF